MPKITYIKQGIAETENEDFVIICDQPVQSRDLAKMVFACETVQAASNKSQFWLLALSKTL
ncbi:hypothetical protein TG4357_01470 [Thalassovita gelatinovora]|uniref:Uncharacterized protein n=1 Tax=Thalassovita gelatinovora TaxID=53501 RepID=A0A0P1FZ80_THAGE|nr:hypothetical protein TG4357_01470 [Thalassovita gelatinovora]SEP92726.1 hypothetical protein SAMN04488043_102205 [Thalassovita gelatinovora]